MEEKIETKAEALPETQAPDEVVEKAPKAEIVIEAELNFKPTKVEEELKLILDEPLQLKVESPKNELAID